MKELLKKYQFSVTNIENQLRLNSYIAIIWNNNTVTIINYTPNTKRLLSSITYKSIAMLKERLVNINGF